MYVCMSLKQGATQGFAYSSKIFKWHDAHIQL